MNLGGDRVGARILGAVLPPGIEHATGVLHLESLEGVAGKGFANLGQVGARLHQERIPMLLHRIGLACLGKRDPLLPLKLGHRPAGVGGCEQASPRVLIAAVAAGQPGLEKCRFTASRREPAGHGQPAGCLGLRSVVERHPGLPDGKLAGCCDEPRDEHNGHDTPQHAAARGSDCGACGQIHPRKAPAERATVLSISLLQRRGQATRRSGGR